MKTCVKWTFLIHPAASWCLSITCLKGKGWNLTFKESLVEMNIDALKAWTSTMAEGCSSLWLFQENPPLTKCETVSFLRKTSASLIIFLPLPTASLVCHSHWSMKCFNSRDSKHRDIDPIKCHFKWTLLFKHVGMCLEHMAYRAQTQMYLKRKCILLAIIWHIWCIFD